ncbi:MAG: ketopantoate reductase family protein [Clostridiales bacterium]|nr:ketopantoate reductase family protein [Clostridiales bacterium]
MKQVSIIGMGALGLMYGSLIQKHTSDINVTYIMDEERSHRYQNVSFEINDETFHFQAAAAENASVADILIVAVKYPALDDAIELMKNCIGPNTVIISVMNGISSEQKIGERYSFDSIVYTVAQGMDAMKFGNKLVYTKSGELRVGITKTGNPAKLTRLIEFFREAGLAYTLEEDILHRMWGKFMLNVGINQTCMVYNQSYGQVLAKGESNRTYFAACREVLAIAAAEGIALSEKDIQDYTAILQTLDPKGFPSMAQDRINKKKSEVDMFAGTVMEIAQKHGIQVPTNEFLYQQVKKIEQYD